jgi:hypothetical protein
MLFEIKTRGFIYSICLICHHTTGKLGHAAGGAVV